MGFFKIKLDNAPENTFENNRALKGWWIRWSNQYFPVIFSMIHFIFCYLIVPVQYPGTTQRLSFRLNSPEVWCADSRWFKRAIWEMYSIPLFALPTTAPARLRLCRRTPLSKPSPAHIQVLLSQTGRFPTPFSFPFSLQSLWPQEMTFPFPSLRTFSAVTDGWGLAARPMVCNMASGMSQPQ